MAAKKRQQVSATEAARRLDRAVLLARRWAKHAEKLEVLSGPSFHLLRAVQKLEEIE